MKQYDSSGWQYIIEQAECILQHSTFLCMTDMFVSSSVVAPLPPSGLSAVHTSPTTITVYWTPPTNGTIPTGYIIIYFAGVEDAIGTVVLVSNSSTKSHNITGLNSTVTYHVNVMSVNGAISSDTTGPVLAARGELCGLSHMQQNYILFWDTVQSVI